MSSDRVVPVTVCGFILLTLQILLTCGFNIETRNVTVIAGPKGTHFGFSASFLPVDPNSGRLGLLVGAPNANTSLGGENSGALHLCRNVLDPAETCLTTQHVDDDISMLNGMVNEEFGAAVAVTQSGKFMVCSPGWKDTSVSYFTFLLGRCAYTDLQNSSVTQSFQPFYHSSQKNNYIRKIDQKFEYYHGMASFGFSIDSDKSSVFVIGAPGVLMSEGTVVIMDVNTKEMSNYTTPLVNKLPSTAFGYTGYSVKVGRFCDGADVCFAASAPNNNRVGMILVYRWIGKKELRLIQMFEERQAWTYFGYALCAADTDGDLYDELLVGAPHYSDLSDKLHGHDQGRVFIYTRSKTQERLMQKGYLDGTRHKFAQFGIAIQYIGDINLDKYGDVAVGAPGEDGGAGCIYIYLGGPAGLVNSPSQRITAKQVSNGLSEPVEGFGFSFSDHAVPEHDAYPVFVATSVASDAIVVFRSRPIVDVTATLAADSNPIDMEVACTETGVTGVCFNVKLCMRYRLRGGGNQALTFQIGLDVDVQVRSNLKRALIRLNSTSLVESVPEFKKDMTGSNIDDCMNFLAVLREHQVNQDRFTPVLIVARYVLLENPSLEMKPVLDATKANNVSLTVTFANKCGDDNVCSVDLSVKGSLRYKHSGNWNNIVVNDTKELYVNVEIKNSRETSYWTVIKVEVDSPLSYSRYTTGASVNCQQEQSVSDGTNTAARTLTQEKTVVLCNYYKPLNQDDSIDLTVVFETEPLELKQALTVTAQALPKNINNPEVNNNDNIINMTTAIQIIADVSVDGSSTPSEVTISEAKNISLSAKIEGEMYFRKTGNEIKPHNVTHKILVRNNGPSFLPTTQIAVSVPMFLLDRTELIDEADVKIVTDDGKVSQCHGTNQFDYFQEATSTPIPTTETDSTDASSYVSGGTSSASPEETTYDFIPVVNARKKRVADDKVENNVYTLNCDVDEICQVFICETGTVIPSGRYAEINVSLVVDLANIPLPEKYNTFHYTIQAEVKQPVHPLFKSWNNQRVTKTVTKFHLVQPGGKLNIWIIIGCVIAGLVLITIIVLVFWKLGFFKRDKHQQVEQWRRASKRQSKKGYSKAPNEAEGAPAEDNPGASLQ